QLLRPGDVAAEGDGDVLRHGLVGVVVVVIRRPDRGGLALRPDEHRTGGGDGERQIAARLQVAVDARTARRLDGPGGGPGGWHVIVRGRVGRSRTQLNRNRLADRGRRADVHLDDHVDARAEVERERAGRASDVYVARVEDVVIVHVHVTRRDGDGPRHDEARAASAEDH